jgi:hypothetical protein
MTSLGKVATIAALAASVWPAVVLAAPGTPSGQASPTRTVVTGTPPLRPAILSVGGREPMLVPAGEHRKRTPRLPNVFPYSRQTLSCSDVLMLRSQGFMPLRAPMMGWLAKCWNPEDPYLLDPFGDGPLLP